MDIASSPFGRWLAIVCAVVVVLILFGLLGTCRTEPDVNTELARATRTAVESAEAARRNNDAAYLLPGRMRMVALAVGVGVPVIAAVVLVWICLRHRPSDLELRGYLEQQVRALEGTETPTLPGDTSLADLPAEDSARPNRLTAPCSRQWKCPSCEKILCHSYEALADVGTPICGECDVDMEMV